MDVTETVIAETKPQAYCICGHGRDTHEEDGCVFCYSCRAFRAEPLPQAKLL